MNHPPIPRVPIRALQSLNDAEFEAALADLLHQQQQKQPAKPALLCRFCRAKITQADAAIEINGSHRHRFHNPLGVEFDIGCFAQAPGCAGHGAASFEYTWFAGYQWQVALCRECHSHLGWLYTCSHAAPFFGLIVDYLIEADLPH
jgi:hypothetical protein